MEITGILKREEFTEHSFLLWKLLVSQILLNLNLQCFYDQEDQQDSHTQKGQGMTQGHALRDSGETQKQRTTSRGKTLSSQPPKAFLIG